MGDLDHLAPKCLLVHKAMDYYLTFHRGPLNYHGFKILS